MLAIISATLGYMAYVQFSPLWEKFGIERIVREMDIFHLEDYLI